MNRTKEEIIKDIQDIVDELREAFPNAYKSLRPKMVEKVLDYNETIDNYNVVFKDYLDKKIELFLAPIETISIQFKNPDIKFKELENGLVVAYNVKEMTSCIAVDKKTAYDTLINTPKPKVDESKDTTFNDCITGSWVEPFYCTWTDPNKKDTPSDTAF